MTFELKDLIYLVGWACSLVAVWITFRNRVTNLEEKVTTVKKIVFKPSGELAVITTERCDKDQKDIKRSISDTDAGMREVVNEMRDMNDNILIIMTHLNIDHSKFNRRKKE